MTFLATWVTSEIDQLKALNAAGCSADVIGKQLGKSRNSIMGKLSRLGLTKPNTTKRLPVVNRKSPIPRVRLIEATLAPEPYNPRQIGWDDLTWSDGLPAECRYITNGDNKPELYCGLPTLRGASWCIHHHAQLTAPMPPRRR